ncbi:LCP family protein [Actinacidiphila sp. bgisy167]|uniref:LCP family protein n=1 Tax=Actinacidiphila sp. bgisy167 TaxID=3413797 RepID=UPI003D74B640
MPHATDTVHETVPAAPAAKAGGSRGRRIRRVVIWTLLALILLTGGGAWWAYQRLDSNLSSIDLEQELGPDRPEKLATGAMDILVLGSDSRSGANKGLAGGDTGGTARSDTAMVLHIPEGRTSAVAVSIPRDTLITRPECTARDGSPLPSARRVMFNSVYTLAGPACVVKTVERISGVRIDHYVEVDFAGFQDLVDSLGGVTITLDKTIHDTSSGLDLEAGTHRLDGTESLAFVRTRHGIGDGSDLGRIGLQQQFLLATLDEVKRQNLLGSPAKAYRVADSATRSLTTDSGLGSLRKLADFGRSLQGLDPDHLRTVMLPVAYDKVDPNRVVAAEPQASRLWKAIREDTAVPRSVLESTTSN